MTITRQEELEALRRISANKARVAFVLDEHGVVRGKQRHEVRERLDHRLVAVGAVIDAGRPLWRRPVGVLGLDQRTVPTSLYPRRSIKGRSASVMDCVVFGFTMRMRIGAMVEIREKFIHSEQSHYSNARE